MKTKNIKNYSIEILKPKKDGYYSSYSFYEKIPVWKNKESKNFVIRGYCLEKKRMGEVVAPLNFKPL